MQCPSQIGLEHARWFWRQDRGAVCLPVLRSALWEQEMLVSGLWRFPDPALGSHIVALRTLPGSAESHAGKAPIFWEQGLAWTSG